MTFSPTSVERLTAEAEEAALKRIKVEQEERLKAKLPDFWLPSLTPTYTSSGPPKDLKDVKVVTTCRGGKDAHELSYVPKLILCSFDKLIVSIRLKTLISVQFTYPKEPPPGVKEVDRRDAMCPSCKKTLSNSQIMYCALKIFSSLIDVLIHSNSNGTLLPCYMQDVY